MNRFLSPAGRTPTDPSFLAAALGAVVFVMVLSSHAFAQESSWRPPEPSPESNDWLMLVSGEWLRGEIKFMRDESMEFDSEELELLDLDWSDIAELRSPRILTYSFGKDLDYTGTAWMRGDTIRIRIDETRTESFYRHSLLSVIEGRPRELNYWSFKLSLGVITRSGNTNQNDLNTIVQLRRQSTRTKFEVNYTGNAGRLNGTTIVNNHRGTAGFDILIAKGLLVTPGYAEVYSDSFQNIDLRLTAGAGMGYTFWRNRNPEASVHLGVGYTKTRFTSVEAGASDSEQSTAVIPGVELDWDITGSVELEISEVSQITVPDSDGTVHNLFAVLSIELRDYLDFDVSLTWDRVENPKTKEDGTIPKRDDFRIAFGLGIDI